MVISSSVLISQGRNWQKYKARFWWHSPPSGLNHVHRLFSSSLAVSAIVYSFTLWGVFFFPLPLAHYPHIHFYFHSASRQHCSWPSQGTTSFFPMALMVTLPMALSVPFKHGLAYITSGFLCADSSAYHLLLLVSCLAYLWHPCTTRWTRHTDVTGLSDVSYKNETTRKPDNSDHIEQQFELVTRLG
jgi:hypothetical protein